MSNPPLWFSLCTNATVHADLFLYWAGSLVTCSAGCGTGPPAARHRSSESGTFAGTFTAGATILPGPLIQH